MPSSSRPSANHVHMETARLWASRSTCGRGQVGAVLVVDGRHIASAYNGSPPGAEHCAGGLSLYLGCDAGGQKGVGCQRATHAEANLIAFAARHGVQTDGATLYCTAGPCLTCARLIVAAGIVAVVYDVPYRLGEGIEYLVKHGLAVLEYAE
jgi:dCMP deaminase